MGIRKEIKVTAESYPEITDGDVQGAFASLSFGHDPVAADNLIRYFHFAFNNGSLFATCTNLGPKEKVFLNFVDYAFQRYTEGKSIDAAFGLVKTKGQRDIPDFSMRNVGIAAEVELLVRHEMSKRDIKERKVKKKSKDGQVKFVSAVKMEPVYIEAANKTGVGWKSVEKIFSEFGEGMSYFPSSVLAILAETLPKS